MRVRIRAVVVNTKGRIFDVAGAYWDDGTFYVVNPRPTRYPEFVGLGFRPGSEDEDEPRRLYWLASLDDLDEDPPGKPSRFVLRSLLVDAKHYARRASRRAKAAKNP